MNLDTTSAQTITVTLSARQQFLTKCQSSKSICKRKVFDICIIRMYVIYL